MIAPTTAAVAVKMGAIAVMLSPRRPTAHATRSPGTSVTAKAASTPGTTLSHSTLSTAYLPNLLGFAFINQSPQTVSCNNFASP